MSGSARRGSVLGGLLALALAAAAPIALWHSLIERLAAGFRLELGYLLVGWSGFALMAVGLAAFLPIALTAGSSPSRRFYPRRRNAWAGWGTSMYLLGLALVVQLAAIAANS